MRTIKKYFDAQGNETTPDKAVKCHELVVDKNGSVQRDSIYDVKPK